MYISKITRKILTNSKQSIHSHQAPTKPVVNIKVNYRVHTPPLPTLHTVAARTGGVPLTSAVTVKVVSWIDKIPSLYKVYVEFRFNVRGD